MSKRILIAILGAIIWSFGVYVHLQYLLPFSAGPCNLVLKCEPTTLQHPWLPFIKRTFTDSCWAPKGWKVVKTIKYDNPEWITYCADFENIREKW